MAIARKWLASRYNKPGFDLFDYNIYAVCGDGCLMEGVGSEAASLAGHLGLDDLCWIYDNNHITIEGNTRITFTEDVAARFLAYHWNVLRVGDANDLEQHRGRARGLPQDQGPADPDHSRQPHRLWLAAQGRYRRRPWRALGRRGGAAHQARLWLAGGRQVSRARRSACEHFDAGIGERGAKARRDWETLFATYRAQFPGPRHRDRSDAAPRAARRDGTATCRASPPDAKGIAGRDASGQVLNVLAQNIPWFLGGSADLAPSNKTTLKFAGAGEFEPGTPGGRNLHFGIREHAMAAIVNGLSLSKLRAFGATFFIFSDYARPGHPALRADGAADHLRLHP